METMSALKARKSVRNFQDKPVEKAKITAIIEAGNHAPNAGPFQITVILDQACLKAINDSTLAAMKNSGNDFLISRANLPGYQPLYGAPALILLSAPAGAFAQQNVACAATLMTVASADLGLGSCYVISPTLALDGKNDLSGKLSLPKGFVPACGVLVGYAGEDTLGVAHEKTNNVNVVE